MADAFSLASILGTVMSFFSQLSGYVKPLSDMVKPLLGGLGGIFVGGGLGPYIGAAIVLVVVILAIKLLLDVGKVILLLAGIAILLFLLTMVA